MTTAPLTRSTYYRPAALVAALCLCAVAAACTDPSDSDTDVAGDGAPSAVDTDQGSVTLPDGAWDAAGTAAEQCDEASAELVVATVATASGYDADYTDHAGRQGYGAFAPVPWEQYGTDNPDDRADLTAASNAVASQLCESYTVAERLSADGVDGTVDDLALSVVLTGEGYTERYGVPDVDAEFDAHDVRASITEITDAAASVAT